MRLQTSHVTKIFWWTPNMLDIYGEKRELRQGIDTWGAEIWETDQFQSQFIIWINHLHYLHIQKNNYHYSIERRGLKSLATNHNPSPYRNLTNDLSLSHMFHNPCGEITRITLSKEDEIMRRNQGTTGTSLASEHNSPQCRIWTNDITCHMLQSTWKT